MESHIPQPVKLAYINRIQYQILIYLCIICIDLHFIQARYLYDSSLCFTNFVNYVIVFLNSFISIIHFMPFIFITIMLRLYSFKFLTVKINMFLMFYIVMSYNDLSLKIPRPPKQRRCFNSEILAF